MNPAQSTSEPKHFSQEGALLAKLLQEGRMSYQGLAEALGTYRQDIWRRMQSLEQTSIWGYQAVLDFRTVGWRRYVLQFPISRAPDAQVLDQLTQLLQDSDVQGPNVVVLDAYFTRDQHLTMQLTVAAADALVLHALETELCSFLDIDIGVVRSNEVVSPLLLSGFSAPQGATRSGDSNGNDLPRMTRIDTMEDPQRPPAVRSSRKDSDSNL